MGQETIQPTPIDRTEYEAFRRFVRNECGQVRGNLKREIENALREYRQPENTTDQLTRIENDVATLKAQIADADSDGGVAVEPPTPTPSDGESTRPRRTDKPAPNQPRSDKIEYLIDELFADSPRDYDGGQVPPEDILSLVQTEYNFGTGTAEKYVDDIIDELGAEPHPLHSRTVVWGDQLEAAEREVGGKIDEVSQ